MNERLRIYNRVPKSGGPEAVLPKHIRRATTLEDRGIQDSIDAQSPENQRRKVVIEHISNVADLLGRIESVKDDIALEIVKETDEQALRYRVIDGLKVKEHLPDIWALGEKFLPYVEKLWGGPLKLLEDQYAVNVNIVPVGGQQGSHYDRNEVTVIIYLTSPRGGENRMKTGKSTMTPVKAEAGRMITLVGANKILHGVDPVLEPQNGESPERIAIVLGYGLPDRSYVNAEADAFLYTTEPESLDITDIPH